MNDSVHASSLEQAIQLSFLEQIPTKAADWYNGNSNCWIHNAPSQHDH